MLYVFLSRFICREVSNAEQINWKTFRATSGAAYFIKLHISGGVDQVVKAK